MILNKALDILFGTHQWVIIYKNKNSNNWIKLEQPNYLSRADPFPIKYNGKFYIFFEEFLINNGKGYICCGNLDFKNQKLKNKKIILKRNYHLSFPFIFSYQNKFFMIPETSKEKKVDLYEFIEFPYKLKFIRTLLNGYSAADTILYKDKNIWYLFTNLSRNLNDLNTYDLSIFQSDCLFEGNFIQKHKNPVVSDNGLARNGGNFISLDNNLFRVSQDCKKRYGHKVNIMKINTFTENLYEESLVNKISPPRGYIAFHTYNICDDIIIADGKRIKKNVKVLLKNFIKLLKIFVTRYL